MAETVTLTQVGKSFQSHQIALPVLHDIQLQIANGEFLAILGQAAAIKRHCYG